LSHERLAPQFDDAAVLWDEGISAGEWVERHGGQITDEDAHTELVRPVREEGHLAASSAGARRAS
jgi:hypothetical protein